MAKLCTLDQLIGTFQRFTKQRREAASILLKQHTITPPWKSWLQFYQERYYNHAGYVLPTPVLNYPGPETPYTRAVEYKQYLHRGGQHSIVVRETSSDEGEPYYPVPTERNQKLYARYKEMVTELEKTGKIQFVGRLAVSICCCYFLGV